MLFLTFSERNLRVLQKNRKWHKVCRKICELAVFLFCLTVVGFRYYILDHLHTASRYEVKGQVLSVSWSVSPNLKR